MLYKATNEAALVTGLKNREQAAFACFYDAYKAKMYGLLLRYVDDKEAAQDLLQDSFVKAWKGIDAYDPARCRLFTWLFAISRNTALDYLRSLKSRPRCDVSIQMHDADSIYHLDQYHSVPAPQGEGVDIREQVGLLAEKYRALLELTYFQGCTYEQAAQRLDLPMGTVKTRIRRGLQLLKEPIYELIHHDAL